MRVMASWERPTSLAGDRVDQCVGVFRRGISRPDDHFFHPGTGDLPGPARAGLVDQALQPVPRKAGLSLAQSIPSERGGLPMRPTPR
jgi:hypothetical protein